MLEVVATCDSKNVSIKIIPDLYEIISGQARTSQLYGFPLIDIMPQLMPEWEKKYFPNYDAVWEKLDIHVLNDDEQLACVTRTYPELSWDEIMKELEG